MEVVNLSCNYDRRPLGVETPRPLLAWELRDGRVGAAQSAYQILAASSMELLDADRGDLWDSGRVPSAQSIQIEYQGVSLASRQKVFWKARVWDGDRQESPWSEAGYWEMGLLRHSDWQGHWISDQRRCVNPVWPRPEEEGRGLLLRKVFPLPRNVRGARAYVCGLGYFELYLNGKPPGPAVLNPGFTRYDKTALYTTEDVAGLLGPGENVIGVALGNGFYNPCVNSDRWNLYFAEWRDNCKLLLQLDITLDDGSMLSIASGPDWKAAHGPVLFNSVRDGETYDARLESEWLSPDFDDSGWGAAVVTRPPGGALRSQQMPPITVIERLKPVAVTEAPPGKWVFDFGRNISGWGEISLAGEAGTEITLRHAERLSPDGGVDSNDMRGNGSQFQTDRYIMRGGGTETWSPRFTYHGFRYIELGGCGRPPTPDALSAVSAHTNLAPRGLFECSDPVVNAIQECVLRTTLANYHGIPTDCPHREKNGWTGDAHLSAEQTLLNFSPMTSYRKWMRDFIDAQRPSGQIPAIIPSAGYGFNWGSGPAWDIAVILIPWAQYLHCGDQSILDFMYGAMSRYLRFLRDMSVDGLNDYGLGDWCAPSEDNGAPATPTALTSTAYAFLGNHVMSSIARLLGAAADAEFFQREAWRIRGAFRREFIDADGTPACQSQTALACILSMGLAEPDERERIIKLLVKNIEQHGMHLDCGILGAKFLLRVLRGKRLANIAHEIITTPTFPSWGHMIANGATTLWERWDGANSQNHHMFSDVGAWFYNSLAGINPDPRKPGFKNIIIRPDFVDRISWVKCAHQSMYGAIGSEWERRGDGIIHRVTVPPNTTAELHFNQADFNTISINGGMIGDADMTRTEEDGEKYALIPVAAGRHLIELK